MQAGTAGGESDKVALYCMLHINTDKRRSSTLLHWQILHIKHFTLIHRCCWITLVWGEKKNTHTVTKTHFVRLANTIQQQVSGQLEHVIGYNQVTHSQWRGRDNPPHPPSLLSRCNSDVAGGSFFFFFFLRECALWLTQTDEWIKGLGIHILWNQIPNHWSGGNLHPELQTRCDIC